MCVWWFLRDSREARAVSNSAEHRLHSLPRVCRHVWLTHAAPRWHVLTRLFGQVILCTKEVSVGARKNAFTLLVEMGHAFLRFGVSQEGETVG